MAHETITKGRHSELLAQTALLANGYSVSEPIAPEAHDLVARDSSGQFITIQVKSLRRRDDRNGEIVLYARKNNGKPYTLEECDMFIGVIDSDVYLIPNREISEYWCPAEQVNERWTKLETTLTKVIKNESEAV